LTLCMMLILHSKKFMRSVDFRLSNQYYKVLMEPFLHMDRLAVENHIQ